MDHAASTPPSTTTASAKPAAATPSTGSPPCSSTGTATGSGETSRHLLDSEHARRAIGEVAVPYGSLRRTVQRRSRRHACPYPVPLRRLRPLPHRRLLPARPARLPRRPAAQPRTLARRHRRSTTGHDRGHPVKRRDHPDPPAHRTGSTPASTNSPPTENDRDRAGRHRRPPPPHRDPRHAPHPPSPARPPPGAHRMTTTSTAGPRTTATTCRGRRADSARRRQRVLTALNRAAPPATKISVSGIARAAGVDRTFLYRHRDLLDRSTPPRRSRRPPPAAGPAVSRASLQADLLAAQQRCARLAARVQPLETRLSEAARRTGLARVRARRTRRHRPTQTADPILEQQVIDLRLQLDERDQDLAAARAANRELMARAQHPQHANR